MLFSNVGIKLTQDQCLIHFKTLNKTEEDVVSFSEIIEFEEKCGVEKNRKISDDISDFEIFVSQIENVSQVEKESELSKLMKIKNMSNHQTDCEEIDKNEKHETCHASFLSSLMIAITSKCKKLLFNFDS